MKYFLIVILCAIAQGILFGYYENKFNDLKMDIAIVQSVINTAVCTGHENEDTDSLK